MILLAWIFIILSLFIAFISIFLSSILPILLSSSGVLLFIAITIVLLIPHPPSNIRVTRGNNTASIEFNHVPHAISYQVTSHPGNRISVGTESPIIVSGLINENSYTFTVKAITSRGTVISKPSHSIIPSELATAPVLVKAIPGDQCATVSFTPTDGNKATSYMVISSPGNYLEKGTSSPITVHGLKNGISYTFTVRASDDLGQFETSTPSLPVIPHILLSVPKQDKVVPMNESVLVYFQPSHNAIEYIITAQPGNHTAIGKTSPIKVKGLKNGISYKISLSSRSIYETSDPVITDNVTPLRPPMAPTDAHVITHGDGEAYIGFTSGYDYNPLISYTATSSSGQISSSTISPILISGLPKGKCYFTVSTTNSAGTSLPSKPTSEINC